MRMQGKSYTEISTGLGMSKSTLSFWFRHLDMPEETRQKINNKAHSASINALLKINRKKTDQAEERIKSARTSGKQDIGKFSKRDIFLVGIILYWTEGYKRPIIHNSKTRTYHPVSLTNADPEKIKLFLRFLRETCGVTEQKITADLRLAEHQNEGHTLEFWRKTTNLSSSNFRKIYKTKSNLPYGTIQIRVNDTGLFHKIMGWIEGIKKHFT